MGDWIMIPTDEQKEQWKREFHELMCWANSVTDAQIDFLCDGGWYNNAIRGYLIKAARNADFTDDQINDLLSGLRFALSECNKRDAEKVSNNF